MNLSDSLTGCASSTDLVASWAQILQDAAPAAARARTAEQARELAILGDLLTLESDPEVWSSLLSSLHTAVVEASGCGLTESAADRLWHEISVDVDLVERAWVCRAVVDGGFADLGRAIGDRDAHSAGLLMRRHLDVVVPELASFLY